MTTPKEKNKTEKLIDISSEKDSDSDETTVSFRNKDQQEENHEQNNSRMERKANTSRLCGYLNKLGNRAILKTFRKRWFVFSENNCKLYYYRSPQDQVPLGEIDISQASFSFDVDNPERTGLFTISVPDRDYFLEANNRKTCLYWLQELQKYRRANSLLRTKHMNQGSATFKNLPGRPQSGLLAKVSPEIDLAEFAKDEAPLMLPIDCPKDVVGDDSAITLTNPFHVAQQKFNEFRSQVITTAFTRHEKSSDTSQNSPCKDSSNLEKLSQSTATTPGSDSEKPVFISKHKNQGLSAFRHKLSSSFRKARLSEDSQPLDNDGATGKEKCHQCHELELNVERLMDELSTLSEEAAASREVKAVLKRQLDIISKEKDTLVQIYQLKESDEVLKLSNAKDEEIVNLTHDVQEQKQFVESLQRHVISLKKEVTDLQQNNEVFQELLVQKDKIIVDLTHTVFDLETEKQDQGKNPRKSSDFVPLKSSQETSSEDLTDAVQAFELQNKFLNKEILELNHLRRDSEERLQLLFMKCSEWEARCYQIQSKLIFLLNELNKRDGKLNPDVLKQLLQEATSDGTEHTQLLPTWSRDKLYDDLGFNWQWGKEDLLSLRATNLMQKSEDIASKAKDLDWVSWQSRWDNLVATLGSRELQRSQELKVLIRMGIPYEYKGKIWKECVQLRIKNYRMLLGSNYYNSLLTSEEYASRLDPSSKQIELDLLRTLPNNYHYENLDSDGVPKLRRILLAFSRHEPSIGYCQGLNRLVAISLLFMDEEDAFWCLVAITKCLMPKDYYSRTLIASQVDQKVLKDLMCDKLPRLHSHLEQNNVDLSLFTFNWFLTVFVDNIPVETYLRIWDVFLYEGSKVLFRYALAFFKICELEILRQKDYMAINKYLRTIAEQMTDIKKITQVAFNDLNPFPKRMINSKRAQHRQIVQAQLDELETIRKNYPRSEEKLSSMDNLSEED